jgi:Schlafen, AlbA_2
MLPPLHRRWTAKDLDALIDAKVKENRFIEYKRELPATKDSDKDLLADVSAFANSSGGTILYGIEEDQGEPIACTGIGSIDAQKTIERLSNIIGNSLDPPLRGFNFDVIERADGQRVLVLQINQSPSAPHMLNKGSPKFYSRGVAGNVPMGSYEIRDAFLAAEGISEKVRSFVQQRCRRIESREIDFPLSGPGQAVLHIIPIEAFSRPRTVSMTDLQAVKKEFVPAVIGQGYGHRYCLDGIAAASWLSEEKILSYALLFRNGCVEATCSCRHADIFQERKVIERFVGANAAPKYEAILRTLGFTTPFFVSLTILGCKGTLVDIDPLINFGLDVRPIDTDFLALPILEWVEDSVDWLQILRHFCDLCSNAMGFPSSLSFKNDGSLV